MPVHGTRGTTGSEGCLLLYSVVGNSLIFPMRPFKTGMLKFMGELRHLDEHALGAQLRTLRARQPLRGLGERQGTRRTKGSPEIGQRYENVRRQSRELLYSIPAALCDEIAAAASET